MAIRGPAARRSTGEGAPGGLAVDLAQEDVDVRVGVGDHVEVVRRRPSSGRTSRIGNQPAACDPRAARTTVPDMAAPPIRIGLAFANGLRGPHAGDQPSGSLSRPVDAGCSSPCLAMR